MTIGIDLLRKDKGDPEVRWSQTMTQPSDDLMQGDILMKQFLLAMEGYVNVNHLLCC